MPSTMAVDGNNLLARAIHAAGDKMTDGQGVPTGPLVLFVNMLSRYLRQYAPDRVVICWDGGRSTYRTAIYPDYKKGRNDRRSEDQQESFDMVQTFCHLVSFPQFTFTGVEADDIIAALWRRRDGEFIILSGDKDLLQLVDNEEVFQIRPGVKPEVWGHLTIREKLGVEPDELPYIMALSGDHGDDVPGVPGVGDVGARKIWEQSGAVWSKVLEHKRVAGHRDIAEYSLNLVDLRGIDVDGVYMPDTYDRPDGGKIDDLVSFFNDLGAATLVEKVESGSLWPSDDEA